MSQSVDFLVVGGGLAGHILQIELEKAGKSTLVLDEKNKNASSVIAAGLVNPIAGKFFTVTWRANEIFSMLAPYYQSLESELKASFFTPKKLKRVFASAGEQNIWLSKAHQEKYVDYCSFSNQEVSGLQTNYGVLEIEQGGQMNVRAFLTACKAHYPNRYEMFEHELLNIAKSTYRDINFKHIVFCEGSSVRNNKLFNYLPFVPMKGELIEIESELEPQDAIFLGPVFIQHVEQKRWRVGATYQPKETSIEPTEEKRIELMSKLDKIINVPYKIIDHYAGIRPATEDRRPIMGKHKIHSNVLLFNGFGSKGISLIPLFAKEFTDYVINDASLHPEVIIDRF
jgi:glycine oxidase